MPDNLTKKQRSYCMSRIKSTNTQPEMLVRRIAHQLGYRFRLHRRGLPGKPDLVFPRLRSVIFVHGCFWHVHRCQRGRIPKSNVRYWTAKRRRNAERDRKNLRNLRKQGWRVLVVWECQTLKATKLPARLHKFLRRCPA